MKIHQIFSRSMCFNTLAKRKCTVMTVQLERKIKNFLNLDIIITSFNSDFQNLSIEHSYIIITLLTIFFGFCQMNLTVVRYFDQVVKGVSIVLIA